MSSREADNLDDALAKWRWNRPSWGTARKEEWDEFMADSSRWVSGD
jgi:hypothetical protein